MREVTRDDKWDESTPLEMHTSPSETELVTVSLLMRLYDLNLAILAGLNEVRADEIYEAHERGEHFNPPIFVPDVAKSSE